MLSRGMTWRSTCRIKRWFSTRMALGSHKYSRMDSGTYGLVVKQAVDDGITVIEAGQDGGAKALADVLSGYNGETKLTALQRLGYTVLTNQPDVPSDSVVLQTMETESVEKPSSKVIHTLGGAAVESFLKESPLLGLQEENIQVIPMIHNPEEHGSDTLSRLTDAFIGLEEAVSAKKIPSFGIASNGFSLPSDHPLYLDWRSVVLKAACDAAAQTFKTNSSLSILQLPANLLETRGLQVARDVHSYLKGSDATPFLPLALQIYLMRPLTCYPDRGAGTNRGFQLIDYHLPTEPGVMEWTNEMNQPPPVYPATYKTALSYFDATEILEAKLTRELSEEEKETLYCAKILRDMVQDADAALEKLSSFSQHEVEIMERIYPVLHGQLGEMDEDSAQVLGNYFAALGLAARYHVATNTRALVLAGGDGVPPYDIPGNMTMQDFAIKELLKEGAVAKIVVGATAPEQVHDTIQIFNKYSNA